MIIKICATTQQLYLYRDDNILRQYTIATAKAGLGELKNSNQTPRGWHYIRAKIGHQAHPNTVFVGRRFTGELYSQALSEKFPERDWILTRILWLSGLEKGMNRLGNLDSMSRYIYIHGCPDNIQLGTPSSKGCIRMRNDEIIELFNLVPVGTRVLITV